MKMINQKISNINKETFNQNDSLLKMNNTNNTIKNKLKLNDLNIIISIICGNQNLSNYQSKFSPKQKNDNLSSTLDKIGDINMVENL